MKKPGAGHIFKRGEIYWLEYTVEGKRYRQTLGTKNAAEAKRKANTILEPHRAGTEADRLAVVYRRMKQAKDTAATSGVVVTLADAWSAFVDLDKEKRPYPGPGTLEHYESQWSAFADWKKVNSPSVKTLARVDDTHATAFVRHLNKSGLTDGSVNKYKRFLKMFFRVMLPKLDNPFGSITAQKYNQISKQPFTVDEMRDIVDQSEGEMQTLYLLGAGTGLRFGDCCTLLWGEVDIARRLIFRVPNKTARKGEAVKIGLPIPLAAHLDTLPRSGPYVLPSLAEEYNAGRGPNISRRIRTHLHKCGIHTVKPGTGGDTGKRAVVLKGFHSFRHSFVSLNADAGTSQATMQKLVGHGSPMMTLHYLTPSDSMVLKAADALPELIGDATPMREPVPEWIVEAVTNAKSLKALRAVLL